MFGVRVRTADCRFRSDVIYFTDHNRGLFRTPRIAIR